MPQKPHVKSHSFGWDLENDQNDSSQEDQEKENRRSTNDYRGKGLDITRTINFASFSKI